MNLEQYISENRDSFDNKELPEGHRQHFEKRRQANTRRRSLRDLMIVAVSAAAVLMFFFIPWSPEEVSDEAYVAEIEYYYSSRINELLSILEDSTEGLDNDLKEEIFRSIDQITIGESTIAEIRNTMDKDSYVTLLVEYRTMQEENIENLASLITNN